MATRPNILLFMPDQLRADAVGAFGNPLAHTPSIDALASRGTVFRQAFAQHSVCSPSRVSILTGWYPHVTGHRTLTHLLKPWEPNLLKILKDSGYNVAWPGLRGDTFAEGVTESSTDFFGFTVPPSFRERSPYPEGHRLADAYYYGRREAAGEVIDLDEATIRTAVQWLGAGPREPWVLFVTLIFPHLPFTVEEPWFSLHDRSKLPLPRPPNLDAKPRFMRALRERHGLHRLEPSDWAEIIATYYGMVSRVDAQLGRVMQAVADAGALDNTVTAFFTDHGEYLGDFGLVEKWPSGLDDCLLRNPLIISAPGAGRGGVCDSLVEMVDLLPTLLELAGIEAQHTHFGRSLVPLLDDPSLQHRDAVFSEGGFTVDEEPLLERAGPPYHHKSGLQHDDPESVGRAAAMRTDRWTFIYRLYERNELYDRRNDPGELINLSGSPELAGVESELQRRLLEWTVATADVIPWKPDARFHPKLVELMRRRRPED